MTFFQKNAWAQQPLEAHPHRLEWLLTLPKNKNFLAPTRPDTPWPSSPRTGNSVPS